DGIKQRALATIFSAVFHVVTQIVETKLVVGAIGNVGLIGCDLGIIILLRHDHADGHAQKAVKAAHPVGVTPREVIVDGHDVHTLAGQRIQVNRQGSHQGLSLTGAHLGNLAMVQGDGTQQLDIKVPHAKDPLAGLPDHGKGLDEQVIKRAAVIQALPELLGAIAQILVGKGLVLGLQRIDAGDLPAILTQEAIVATTYQLSKQKDHYPVWATCPKATRSNQPILFGWAKNFSKRYSLTHLSSGCL